MQRDKLQFNIMFRPEPEGGFTAIAPSLPGCITYGKTLKESKKMVSDAIAGYLASVKKHREKITSDENSFISLIQVPFVKRKAHA